MSTPNAEVIAEMKKGAREAHAILETMKFDIDERGEGPDLPAAQDRLRKVQEILREMEKR